MVEFGGGDLVERVTDVCFTDHAIKKAMKRFNLPDREAAAEWLADQLDEAREKRPTRDGGTAFVTEGGIEVIAQVKPGRVLVVTVYPKQLKQDETKRRRRRLFRQSRRLREV